MDRQDDGRIVGKPTLLATFSGKLDPQAILSAIGGAGYPLDDVSVYYRVEGTDQVIDATTGQVAAGQALSAEQVKAKALEKLDTLVLLHPDGAQFVAVQDALKPLGEANILYAEQSIVGGDSDGEGDSEVI